MAIFKEYFYKNDLLVIIKKIYFDNWKKYGDHILSHAFKKINKYHMNIIFHYFALHDLDSKIKSLEEAFSLCTKKISENEKEQLKDKIIQMMSLFNSSLNVLNSDNDYFNLNRMSDNDNNFNSTLDQNDNDDLNFSDSITNDSNLINIFESNVNILNDNANNGESITDLNIENDDFNQYDAISNFDLNPNNNDNSNELESNTNSNSNIFNATKNCF